MYFYTQFLFKKEKNSLLSWDTFSAVYEMHVDFLCAFTGGMFTQYFTYIDQTAEWFIS